MKRSPVFVVVISILLLLLVVWLTIQIEEGKFTSTGTAVNRPGAGATTPACPITVADSRMTAADGTQVSTIVTNTSSGAISTLAFGASHTDKFGNTQEPFQSDLTWDQIIAPGAQMPMQWKVPMEQPSLAHNRAANSSELHLTKLVYSDGRVLSEPDLAQCSFSF